VGANRPSLTVPPSVYADMNGRDSIHREYRLLSGQLSVGQLSEMGAD
jgi:hypothetical protein